MGVITLSRQIGAGETTVAPAVAAALGWECVDAQMLDRAVEESGIALPYAAHYDERPRERVERWRNPDEPLTYFHALARVVARYAEAGNVVLVGRGANFLLGEADALHFRLIADTAYRIRRVMEVRWVNEGPAKEIIAHSDRDRARFVRQYFHANWEDPVHYHAVLNTSRLGIDAAVERIVAAARAHWPTGEGAT